MFRTHGYYGNALFQSMVSFHNYSWYNDSIHSDLLLTIFNISDILFISMVFIHGLIDSNVSYHLD